jgi:excisionase family DNA binding protein
MTDAIEALDLLTPKEAAAFLRLSPATMYQFKKQGVLPYLKMGRRVFFRRSTLLDFVTRSERLNEPAEANPEQLELFDE